MRERIETTNIHVSSRSQISLATKREGKWLGLGYRISRPNFDFASDQERTEIEEGSRERESGKATS